MRAVFKRRRHGVEVRLDGGDRTLLCGLLDQLDALLDDGSSATGDPLAALVGMDLHDPADGPRPAPEAPVDPALARLLPDGSRDDPEAAAEYRRLTERDLRTRKREGARRSAAALRRPDPVLLDEEEAHALLTSLTNLRLVIAERLGLRTDQDAEQLHHALLAGASPEDPWVATAAVYDVLTWWQESLVGTLPR